MPTFQPPTDNFHSLADFSVDLPNSPEVRRAYGLLRHYGSLPRGRNVYKLDTGTYTENEPSDMTTVVITYYGGHVYDLTEQEAADLTAAGYGAYIS
jgi:hypothetical protein